MERNELDVLICGSSRPQLLIYLLESLDRFVISQSKNTDFRLLLNEDCLQPGKSEKSIEMVKERGGKILAHNPPIGYGPGMKKALVNHIETEYMLALQDDWEFERTGIDIDRILWVMELKKGINSVVFNKWSNQKQFGALKEYNYHGIKLSIAHQWHVLPGIWRVSVARRHWQAAGSHPVGAFMRELGGVAKEPEDAVRRIGSYWYGGMGEQRWVRHNGNTWKTTKWGKGGERIEHDLNQFRYKPPWLPYEARPTNKKIQLEDSKDKEMFLKVLEKLPEDVRKEYER
jgi:hypothetical protein